MPEETILEETVSQFQQTVDITEDYIKFNYGFLEQSKTDMTAVASDFFKSTKKSTDILPPVTRWVSKDNSTIAVERPPFSCTIKYEDIQGEIDPDYHDSDCDPDYGCDCEREPTSFNFSLNIPWTVWFFQLNDEHLQDSKVFCRPGPLTSFDDELFALPVTNLYGDARICWGSNIPVYKEYGSLSSFVLDAINGFWTDTFNNDLVAMIMDHPPFELRGHFMCNEFFEDWSKLTMDDVLSLTFGSLLGHEFENSTFEAIAESFENKIHKNNENSEGHIELSKFFWDLAQ